MSQASGFQRMPATSIFLSPSLFSRCFAKMTLYKLIIIVILAGYLFVLLVQLFRKFILKGWLKLLGPRNAGVRREVERRMLERKK